MTSIYSPENGIDDEPAWGRVLICGGTNWATNGRKDRPASSTNDDLLEPRILRSLSNIKITKIISGPTANYAMAIDIHGAAYLFGKLPCSTFGIISESAPLKITPASLGSPSPDAKFVTGSTARGHMLLVDDQGWVWGCGNNITGQIGLPTVFEVDKFTRVTGPWLKEAETKIIQVSTGNTFSLFLTDSGQVYAAGSSESGQLGNGKTGERLLKANKIAFDLETPPRLVQNLSGKHIVQIASGNQHSLCLDSEGYVYAWGYAGYSRLGLQDQKDRLQPTLVPQFASPNLAMRARSILCGPTSSVVITAHDNFYIAGKFKLTGDGGVGQPYTSFKSIQEIMFCNVIKSAVGGCTHFLTTPEDAHGAVTTVGFGQGALYGELGLGKEAGKSASKPMSIIPLKGVDVIDIAGGAFFSLFLARPNSQLTDLERFPPITSPSTCVACNEDKDDVPIECEKCEIPYHLGCADPPLDEVPEREWFCEKCGAEQDAGLEGTLRPVSELYKKPKPPKKRSGSMVISVEAIPGNGSDTGMNEETPEIDAKPVVRESPASKRGDSMRAASVENRPTKKARVSVGR